MDEPNGHITAPAGDKAYQLQVYRHHIASH